MMLQPSFIVRVPVVLLLMAISHISAGAEPEKLHSDAFFDYYYKHEQSGWNKGGVRWSLENKTPDRLKVWTVRVGYECGDSSREVAHYISSWVEPGQRRSNVGYDYPCGEDRITGVHVIGAEFLQSESRLATSQTVTCDGVTKSFLLKLSPKNVLVIKTSDGISYTQKLQMNPEGELLVEEAELRSKLCGDKATGRRVLTQLRRRLNDVIENQRLEREKACKKSDKAHCYEIRSPRLKYVPVGGVRG